MARQIRLLDSSSDISHHSEDKQIGEQMITALLILWILIKLQAPVWCYVVAGVNIFMQSLGIIIHMLEKRLEKLNDEIERKHRLEELSGR